MYYKQRGLIWFYTALIVDIGEDGIKKFGILMAGGSNWNPLNYNRLNWANLQYGKNFVVYVIPDLCAVPVHANTCKSYQNITPYMYIFGWKNTTNRCFLFFRKINISSALW